MGNVVLVPSPPPGTVYIPRQPLITGRGPAARETSSPFCALRPPVNWDMNSVLLLLLVSCLVEPAAVAPLGKEQYPMPPSVLQALSSRGTLVLESAMKNALLSLEEALSERARRLQECEECVPCLFGDCGNWTGKCASSELPPGSLPSCEAVMQAQATEGQSARNWALSRVCASYQRLCLGRELSTNGCIHLMTEHCQLRLQECRLERDMDYLNTVADQAVPGENAATGVILGDSPFQKQSGALPSRRQLGRLCGHRTVLAPNETMVKGKIVGGSKAWHGAWPWLASVRLNGELMCSGVLVGDTWVLTAAHCFTGSSNELAWSVVLGDYDLTKPDEGEQAVPVSRILPHPKFNPKTFHNDVALLELSSPVAASAWVAPVCLPEQPAELGMGTLCYIIGWGSLYEDGPAADVVMEARVPVLAQDICRSVLGRQLFTNTMFCAGYLSGGVDSCQSPSSHEPTCFELLALAQMPPERQLVELNHLCAFYTQRCSPAANSVACGLTAEEECKVKRQQCELRSYAQTLLEFLHRAEEFFRTQIDFSFLTRSLPQFMLQVYRHLFPAGAHQDSTVELLMGANGFEVLPAGCIPIQELYLQYTYCIHTACAAQDAVVMGPPRTTFPPFASLFRGAGPGLSDWVQALKAMAEGPRMGTGGEEQLFSQHTDKEVEELQDRGQLFVRQLWRGLGPQGAFPDVGAEHGAASVTPTLVPNGTQPQDRA
ncbi:hypothetical protein lerEdw1_008839 [Lerista edwardsae]|nr:hypothetical protein lerEdw1_008839 [Lerista edwardsae]